MKQRTKGWLSFIGRLAASGILLWVLFAGMEDKGRLIELVKTANVSYVFYAFLPFMLIHCLLLLRWRVFIEALDLDIPWINMARYFFLGLFGNLFLPTAIGGDVIKTVGLCVNAQEKPKIVASVLLDRLSGFAGMTVVSCIALLFGFQILNHPMILLAVGIMVFGLTFIGCVLFNEKLYRFFCHVFHFFPKLKNAVIQMHYDIALLKGRRIVVVKTVALAAASQILLAVTFFALTKALHQDTAFFYFLLFTPIACLASSFPSIGGLGFREGALEYLLAHIGLASGIGVSIGLLDFLFMVIVGVFGWIFFMVTKNQPGAVLDQKAIA